MLQIQHTCKEYRTGNLVQKALDEGGVTDCIETDNGYYVAKVTSLFDQ